ncbi:hypothetical protein [Steroidobacter sp.]|uniref:hypothetical protein n=1 Tax=Steroidobacter sp. TaxID=1978227 RepID=UPI001A5BBB6D|nr:hypothetical protein [Steroidobacter sp.]MBL8271633.1 hypothetical protein [Steroidobacter sp.]
MKHLLWVSLLALAGCASQPTVKSWLDPVSSATITAQIEPLVLNRVEPKNDFDARDYAQLSAVEVNRMGDRRLYLVAILWTSGDLAQMRPHDFSSNFSQVELSLGERSVSLERYTGKIEDLGIANGPLPLPIPGSQHLYFPIERADLRALAQANRVKLTAVGVPDAPQGYEEWNESRRGLADFVSQLPPESAFNAVAKDL